MKTKWLLVGNGNYDDSSIDNVSTVLDSIDLLEKSVKSVYGVSADVLVHQDLLNHDFLDAISDFFSSITINELPVFYFCGHGFSRNQDLYLTAKDSNSKAIINSSVGYNYIRDCIMENQISRAVIILDCCYSGTANGLSLSDDNSNFLPRDSCPEIICITSCKGIERAYFDAEGRAEFTACFASIITNGIENQRDYFTFADIYKELKEKLSSQNPTIASTGLSADFGNIPNNYYKTAGTSLIFNTENIGAILKVLFVKSAIDHPIKADGDFGVPLGLWLLKSYIQRTSTNIQVDIFDERLRNLQHNTTPFEECIKEYDVIGVSMCSCEVPPSIEKARIAKKNGKITIAGGIFTYSNEEYLLNNSQIDFVIPGVGTKPLEQLLTELRKRKSRDPSNWKEKVWQQIKDNTFETIGLKNVFSKANLDDAVMWDAATMPHIELDIWDEIVHTYGPYLNGKIDIYSSRGCDKTCSFCSVQRETKHNVISCDQNQIVRTIKYLYEKGIRQFSIKDEDFFIYGQSRVRNILEEFKGYDDISFKVRARIDTMLASKISAEELAQYHIKEIQYGVESPSSDMRRYVQKFISNNDEDVINLFKEHNKYNIVVNASFILGLPAEDGHYYDSLSEFIQKIYTPGLTKVYLNFYTPHPVRGRIPDDVNIVTNDLKYYTHKIPVCYPKNPKMKVLVRQKMLAAYDRIVAQTNSKAYNPAIPAGIKKIFARDGQLASNNIMRYGGDTQC